MKCVGILLLQLLITATGFWYVFHNPQKPAQIAEALRYASISWVLLGWACYSVVEVLATVRWQILFSDAVCAFAQLSSPPPNAIVQSVEPLPRFACRDSAFFDADRRLSRFSARLVARERFREGFLRRPERPFARSRFAWRFVRALPRFGGGNFTPARRAFDKPMAIACSGDRAPCSPSRMCSISSRTNSPACVEGDFPSRSSSRALSIACSSGIPKLFRP